MRVLKLLAMGLLALGTASATHAQNWPSQTVRLVVAYPAGGGLDQVARLVQPKLAERWGAPVVVDNRPGASGSIGTAYVAKATPDGHTILLSAITEVTINQFVMKNLAYDPEKDLRPVTLMVRLPFVLVTNPSRPYTNMDEFLAHAREHPGKVTYASSGQGTPQHLAAVMLEQMAGIRMVHVPYKGIAPSIADLLAGHVDIGFAGLPVATPHIQAKAFRTLGMSSSTRAPSMPDVPPVGDTKGLEGFEMIQWFGVFAPAGTPDAVVQRVRNDFAEVLGLPDVRETLLKLGAEPSGMPTAGFEAFVRSEREKFERIVRTLDLN